MSECFICCETVKKYLKCSDEKCSKIFCIICMERSLSTIEPYCSCMACRTVFRNKFLEESLGKQFLKIIRQKVALELVNKRKLNLPNIQPLVDWLKIVESENKKLRFGIKPNIPEKPVIMGIKNSMNCPDNTCRGFIINNTCGVCNKNVCEHCREIKTDEHTCNEEVLKSVALLTTDSKPCPKCLTPINKSEGCNDMFCTNCHTHFDWISLEITKENSNHHYNNLQKFSQKTNTDYLDDKCDSTKITIPDDIRQVIFDDIRTIRLLKKKMLERNLISSKYNDEMIDIDVKYLGGQINESKYESLVYSKYQRQKLHSLYADVLDIYLNTIHNIQQNLAGKKISESLILQIKEQIHELISLCNESFRNIQEEYEPNYKILVTIRNIDDDPRKPSILI